LLGWLKHWYNLISFPQTNFLTSRC